MTNESTVPDGLVLFVCLDPPKEKGGFYDGDVIAKGWHLGNAEETASLSELIGGGCALSGDGKVLLASQAVIDRALKRHCEGGT